MLFLTFIFVSVSCSRYHERPLFFQFHQLWRVWLVCTSVQNPRVRQQVWAHRYNLSGAFLRGSGTLVSCSEASDHWPLKGELVSGWGDDSVCIHIPLPVLWAARLERTKNWTNAPKLCMPLLQWHSTARQKRIDKVLNRALLDKANDGLCQCASYIRKALGTKMVNMCLGRAFFELAPFRVQIFFNLRVFVRAFAAKKLFVLARTDIRRSRIAFAFQHVLTTLSAYTRQAVLENWKTRCNITSLTTSVRCCKRNLKIVSHDVHPSANRSSLFSWTLLRVQVLTLMVLLHGQ